VKLFKVTDRGTHRVKRPITILNTTAPIKAIPKHCNKTMR